MWAQIIGMGMKTGGSLLSMKSAYDESQERESIARYNAGIALEDGLSKKRSIDYQNTIEQDIWRSDLAEMEAMGGVRGIIMDEGSPLLVETEEYADMISDGSELNRQGEIARIAGENKSRAFDREAESIRKSKWANIASIGLQSFG